MRFARSRLADAGNLAQQYLVEKEQELKQVKSVAQNLCNEFASVERQEKAAQSAASSTTNEANLLAYKLSQIESAAQKEASVHQQNQSPRQ